MMHRFSGNPLNRSATNKKLVGFLLECIDKPNGRWILYRNMKIYFEQQIKSNEDLYQLKYATLEEILRIFQLEDKDQLIQYFFDNIVILGDIKDEWYFAINMSHLTNEEVSYIAQNSNTTVFPNTVEVEGRKLLVGVSQEDAAISGQVLSLFNFHKAHQYLGFTGEVTRSIEGGLKRMGLDSGLKVYPRLDPVMIACVVSPDLKYCLLGHMKHFPHGFYSCLSGFVEPCESVQEAVIREIKEESGVDVDPHGIYIIDSQPWPIGRGGGCELMIGCLAIAKTTEIVISDAEVADVQWFAIHQIKALIEKYAAKSSQSIKTEMKSWEDSQSRLNENYTRSSHSSSSASSSSHSSSHGSEIADDDEEEEEEEEGEKEKEKDDISLFGIDDEEMENIRIPGDYAIAHHLLRRYVDKEYDIYFTKKLKKEKKKAINDTTPPHHHHHHHHHHENLIDNLTTANTTTNTNTTNTNTTSINNNLINNNATVIGSLLYTPNNNNDDDDDDDKGEWKDSVQPIDNKVSNQQSSSSSSSSDDTTSKIHAQSNTMSKTSSSTINTIHTNSNERFWMWTTMMATSTALIAIGVSIYVSHGGKFHSLHHQYHKWLVVGNSALRGVFNQRFILTDSNLRSSAVNNVGLTMHCAK